MKVLQKQKKIPSDPFIGNFWEFTISSLILGGLFKKWTTRNLHFNKIMLPYGKNKKKLISEMEIKSIEHLTKIITFRESM